jgi:glycine/D-amino acid oxidase-like deaminating enzyme/nitrite reductase/ring-hydroxylating ferredoxin subunit
LAFITDVLIIPEKSVPCWYVFFRDFLSPNIPVMTNRDGACTSLWQDSVTVYNPDPEPAEKRYDVAIIGGGITGISTALLLQQAGKRCMVLEAQTICFGTTSGTTAHLNTLLDTPYTTLISNFGEENARMVARSAEEAILLVEKNIEGYGIDCGFERKPAYLFSQTKEQSDELEKIFDACLKMGLDTVYNDQIPVPVPFDYAIQVENQAQFNPLQYVYALARAFEEAGGVIVQHCAMENAEGDDPVRIETTRGTYEAGVMIFATHIPIGVNLLHLRCAPYRSYAMAVKLVGDSSYPDALAYDMQDPYHYYRSQVVHGERYLIAGGKDHKTAHEENTASCFRKLEATVRQYFPIKEIAYKWSSQYYEPADGLPYIGHLPGHPGNWLVATGFGGNGMIYSNIAAIVLKNMIMGEHDPRIALFDPNRIKPVAGFVNFIKENADVARELISKLLPTASLEELAGIAHGEARIVRYEGEKIALYKDEDGGLHAVDPACTHLKCNVSWNNAERSWDCPCHGARFTCDGKVLNGPANRNLHQVSLAPDN